MNKYLPLILLGFLTACATGKRALQHGEYDKAVQQAVNRLKSNDDSKKARSTLKKAYRLAIDLHSDNISRANASSDQFKWETITYEYQSINTLYNAIRRCPPCLEIIPNPVKNDQDQASARQKAAQVRYELGTTALGQRQFRSSAIEAHHHFKIAKDLVPRFRDIDDKLAEALYHATLKVVVEPIPSPARVLDIRHEFFVNKINEYLHHQMIDEYVRFFTPQEVVVEKVDHVDHIVKMEFDRFSLGNVFRNTSEKEVRDTVEVNTHQRDQGPQPRTKKEIVTATLKTTEISISGGGVLDFRVIDNTTNKVLTQEKMPSQYTWTAAWASFDGDKRALSDEQLILIQNPKVLPPSAQVMFEEFTAPLYDQVISKIRGYYRGY